MRTVESLDAEIAALQAERRAALRAPKDERRRAIAADYVANMAASEIMAKYGITRDRVYAIASEMGVVRGITLRKLMTPEQRRIYNKLRYVGRMPRDVAWAEAVAGASA